MHKIAVPTSAATLYSLIGGSKRCTGLTIQAPETNSGDINIGTNQSVPFAIAAGSTVKFSNFSRYDQVYIQGTSGDYAVVILY